MQDLAVVLLVLVVETVVDVVLEDDDEFIVRLCVYRKNVINGVLVVKTKRDCLPVRAVQQFSKVRKDLLSEVRKVNLK